MTSLSNNQMQFLSFLLSSGALLFGDFTTKSGRKTPYFINTGKLNSGRAISTLGDFYATHIHEVLGENVDIIFGPAYKGIPLAVATASSLFRNYAASIAFSFDRKEAKEHGDKGLFVGTEPADGHRIVIVEDVVTAGTTLRSIAPMLRAHAKVEIVGTVISVDRCEVGTGTRSAVRELEEELSLRIFPLLTIHQIVDALSKKNASGVMLSSDQCAKIATYLETYGAKN